jgi:hypothetical protein
MNIFHNDLSSFIVCMVNSGTELESSKMTKGIFRLIQYKDASTLILWHFTFLLHTWKLGPLLGTSNGKTNMTVLVRQICSFLTYC